MSNIVKLVTREDYTNPGVFLVYWATGLMTKGIVRVSGTVGGDSRTRSELAALRHLLVNRNVAGHNKGGGGLVLHVSCQEIEKLMRSESDKDYLVRYATFLRTRFLGMTLIAGAAYPDWATPDCALDIEDLVVTRAEPERVLIKGIGEVELSIHAVEQFVARSGCRIDRAWKKLVTMAGDATPVVVEKGPVSLIRDAVAGSQYAISSGGTMLFVVANGVGKTRGKVLVTVCNVADGSGVALLPAAP